MVRLVFEFLNALVFYLYHTLMYSTMSANFLVSLVYKSSSWVLRPQTAAPLLVLAEANADP